MANTFSMRHSLSLDVTNNFRLLRTLCEFARNCENSPQFQSTCMYVDVEGGSTTLPMPNLLEIVKCEQPTCDSLLLHCTYLSCFSYCIALNQGEWYCEGVSSTSDSECYRIKNIEFHRYRPTRWLQVLLVHSSIRVAVWIYSLYLGDFLQIEALQPSIAKLLHPMADSLHQHLEQHSAGHIQMSKKRGICVKERIVCSQMYA